MNFIEALNLALDALELSKPAYMQECVERHQNAITALNAAITEMEKQEPVAWCDTDEDGEIAWDKDSCFSDDPAWFDNPMPLYAHPAPAVEKVEPVAWIPSAEWAPCVKLPVTVHVRKQRDGETHVSTREGITPVKPDDLIMRGVSGEEYPIGRAIFEQTYRICDTHPAPAVEKVEPVLDVIRQAIEERDAAIADCDLLATERHDIRNEKWRITGDSRYRPPNSSVSTDVGRATAMQAHEEMKG